MKIIKPSFEIWEQNPGLEGIYEMIEKCGRICYASDPIEGKAKDFVDRMIKNGHTAMLEHGTVYLAIPMTTGHSGMSELHYFDNKYSIVNESTGLSMLDEYNDLCDCWCITTNLRVIVENNWFEDLQYLCEPTKFHEKRITVHFTTNIGVSREFNRHRVDSIAEQSTRYCNYNQDKFDGVSINLPTWINESNLSSASLEGFVEDLHLERTRDWIDIDYWLFAILACEFSYRSLILSGRKPQEARAVLSLSTNTELIHTASVSDWNHFFDLRARGTTGAPHPDAKVLAEPLMEEFKSRGWVG